MKAILITEIVAKPAIAVRVPGKDYFNIKHGSIGKGLHKYSMGIAKSLTEDIEADHLKLETCNFDILPIRKGKDIQKDRFGNAMYYLIENRNSSQRSDLLAFWEIPDKGLNAVSFKIDGNVVELAKGYNGKDRELKTTKVPAPVLEITGDCTLTWCGTDDDGVCYGQHLVYKDHEWVIPVYRELPEEHRFDCKIK